ncbi:MAG: M24 family metallopeptidase [Bacillota bacterium]|jgi:Xaa-Pro aminopeptidase
MNEYVQKHEKLKKLICAKKLDGILIVTQQNFSWLTGGKAYVNIATQLSICKILVTKDKLYLIGNNVDIPLILAEEIKDPYIKSQIETKIFNWQDSVQEFKFLHSILKGKIAIDTSINDMLSVEGDLYSLRTVLSFEEIERYRILGQETAYALEQVVFTIKKGDSEREIAGKVISKLYSLDIFPVVLLVAVDERALKYRHPLPTDKRLERHAVLSVCGRRNGLIVSATRVIHFGKPSEELAKRHNAVVKIDDQLIRSTRPGNKLGDILQKGLEIYKNEGYFSEWQLHFQGGVTGYNTRECKATVHSEEIIQENQVFAWNPSISGTKSEDTFLVLTNQNECITETGDFPYIEKNINNLTIKRPAILVRN